LFLNSLNDLIHSKDRHEFQVKSLDGNENEASHSPTT